MLMNKQYWSKGEIAELLREHEISHHLRYGFTFTIAIANADVAIKNIRTVKKCIILNFDKTAHLVSTESLILENGNRAAVETAQLLINEKDLAWDLNNFGYVLFGGVPLEELYLSITTDIKHINDKLTRVVDEFINCEDIIRNSNVPAEIKKITLDVYTLIMTGFVAGRMPFLDDKEVLIQYASIFFASFITRAKYEKLMLLIAKVDGGMNYDKLDHATKMKKEFRRQAEQSQLEITRKISRLIEDLEILDDNFRTPETHT